MMTPARWWAAWTFDPGVLVWLAAAAASYRIGAGRLRVRPSRGREVCFAGGLALFALALVSPLDQLGGQLFVAHMAQHLLLGLVAPLLVVAAHPGPALGRLVAPARRGWERRWRRWRRMVGLHPTGAWTALVAAAVHVAVMWLWHLPATYDAAVRHNLLHVAEHASLVATGLWFWSAVMGPGRVRWRSRVGGGMLALFVAGLGTGALAALLTLSPTVLYQVHLATTPRWGLTPLEDQQLAGAVMWVPGGVTYALAAIVLLVRWLEAGPARHAAPTADEGRPGGAGDGAQPARPVGALPAGAGLVPLRRRP